MNRKTVMEIIEYWRKFASSQQDSKEIGSKDWEYYFGMEIGMLALKNEFRKAFRRKTK